MDWQSPPWGFAAVGGVGMLVALLVLAAELRNRRTGRSEQAAAAYAAGDAARDGIGGTDELLGSTDSLGGGAAGPAVEMPPSAPERARA